MVVFDEFDHTWFPAKQFKRIIDGYPLLVQYKGGFMNWSPELVVITSNEDPSNWYTADQWPMVKRRIEMFYYFYDVGKYVKSDDYDTVLRLAKDLDNNNTH